LLPLTFCRNPMSHPSAGGHLGYIKEPTMHDVLCGKGGEVNNHEGNKRYLKIVEANKPNYRRASKGAKKELSQLIVQWVNNGGYINKRTNDKLPNDRRRRFPQQPHVGRFIKKSTINNLWYEIDNYSAWNKVSQAFRERGDRCPNDAETDAGGEVHGAHSLDEDAEPATEQTEAPALNVPTALSKLDSVTRSSTICHESSSVPTPLGPVSRDQHSEIGPRACCQTGLKQEQKQHTLQAPPQEPLQPSSLPATGLSLTVAPTPPSAYSPTLAVVNAFVLLSDGMSRAPTTLCVPMTAVALYANQILVPMSMISRMELRSAPPPILGSLSFAP
jgi:hypothetical protein